MATVPGQIHFYFDFISSNAYLAWHALPELAARHGYLIEPVPVLFAGLLEAHGQLGPAEIPAKSLWMWRNNLRKAALLGLPLNPPVFHPFNPLLALRVASLPLPTGARGRLISALFDAVWVHGLHVSEPEVVADVATSVGLAGPALIDQARAQSIKDGLRAATDAAIAAGVFGVPSMRVGGEIFWGYDDLPYLAMALGEDDPLRAHDPTRTMTTRQASARRRRFREAD